MKEKGSILILTLISVLLLSVLATGLLTVGTTETVTTKNYHLSKKAYYEAVRGVEEIRNFFITGNAEQIPGYQVWPSQTKIAAEHGIEYYYITGSLLDLEGIKTAGAAEPGEVQKWGFEGGGLVSLGFSESLKVGDQSADEAKRKIYLVNVTSEVSYAKTSTYAEILAGIMAY